MRVLHTYLAVLSLLLLALTGCPYRETTRLVSVDDDPLWQDHPTDPIHLVASDPISRSIPSLGCWPDSHDCLQRDEADLPIILSEDNGDVVLRAMYHPILPQSRSPDIEGIIEWNITSGNVKTTAFQNHGPITGQIFIANLPLSPGPEFFIVEHTGDSIPPGTAWNNVRIETIWVFSSDGRALNSLEVQFSKHGIGFCSRFPLEYPDFSRLLCDTITDDRGIDGSLLDLEDGTWTQLARVNSNFSAYSSETSEQFEHIGHYPPLSPDELEIVCKRNNVDSPFGFPRFPRRHTHGAGSSLLYDRDFHRLYDNLVYTHQDDRYLLVTSYSTRGVQVTVRPSKTEKWWLVRFNETDTAPQPVWLREEPYSGSYNLDVITVGEDDHPVIVAHYYQSCVVRVIDFLSGHCLLDLDLRKYLFNYVPPHGGPVRGVPGQMPLRLNEDRDIPSIFIFDGSEGNLVEVKLEVE